MRLGAALTGRGGAIETITDAAPDWGLIIKGALLMRYLGMFLMAVIGLSVALMGCGGGGGGNSSGGPVGPDETTPASREREFVDAAIMRVRDKATVTCESVTCAGDGTLDEFIDRTLGTIAGGCEYRCLPVQVDETEVRHYWIAMAWRRIPSTCFDPDVFDTPFFFQITQPCIPTE